MMSINDTPFIRQMFAEFNIKDVQLTYGLGTAKGSSRKQTGELLVMNYEPTKAV